MFEVVCNWSNCFEQGTSFVVFSYCTLNDNFGTGAFLVSQSLYRRILILMILTAEIHYSFIIVKILVNESGWLAF